MNEKYINEQIEKSPDLKEFGGLDPECLSDESDLQLKSRKNIHLYGNISIYSDTRYIGEIEKRA